MLKKTLKILSKNSAALRKKCSNSVSDEDVRYAFRLIIGREVKNKDVLNFHKRHKTLDSLRRAFFESDEFANYFREISPPRFNSTISSFLIEPCADRAVPSRFEPPTLGDVCSQMCTAAQFEEPAYARWCATLRAAPTLHRKQWEFVFALQALESFGAFEAGRRGLGFGTGIEPLPSIFASLGISVMATDAPADLPGTADWWSQTAQHAQGAAQLWRQDIVEKDIFDARVAFAPVDMNNIPDDLTDYDFVWSCCAYEHLGSIENGLRFVERSLACLKPGGVAVHTTELNLSSNDRTLDLPGLCLFRKQDFERLASRLTAAGHEVAPLNFYPGTQPLDIHIDLPPYSMPHLKLLVAEYVTTSFGLIVRKRA